MRIPKIIFNDSTDYDAVLASTKLLFSELVSKSCGCNCGCGDANLCKTLTYITAADINKANNNIVNYQEAVQAAYLTLGCNDC